VRNCPGGSARGFLFRGDGEFGLDLNRWRGFDEDFDFGLGGGGRGRSRSGSRSRRFGLGGLDAEVADEDGTGFDDDAARFDVPKHLGRGFEGDGAAGAEVGGEVAGDLGGVKSDGVLPGKVIAGRDDEAVGLEGALDLRGAVDGEGFFRGDLAKQAALEGDIAGDDLGVEDVDGGFDDEAALGLEVFGGGLVEGVILQIHVAAAALAHGGLGAGGDIEFRTALEAGDVLEVGGDLLAFGRRAEQLLQSEMPVAFLADGGEGSAGFELQVAAMRAGHLHFILLARWHLGHFNF